MSEIDETKVTRFEGHGLNLEAEKAGSDAVLSMIKRARKSPEEVSALVSAKKEFMAISVDKKPPKEKYCRVREGKGWHFRENVFLILPPDFSSERRECLFLSPDLEEFVDSKPQLKSAFKSYGLAFLVDTNGTPAFWALNLLDSGNWGQSARLIADRLRKEWGTVCSGSASYLLESPEDDLGEPQWPEGDVDHWLGKAFANHVIDSADHPEIKKLLGKK